LHILAEQCRKWDRAYAAFAGLVVAATAAMPLLPGPLPWLARPLHLVAPVSSSPQRVGSTPRPSRHSAGGCSRHILGAFVALALGQLLIAWAEIKTAAPFSLISILFAAALVMVSTTRAEPPHMIPAAKLPFGQLSRAAPVAVVGCVLSGLIGSTFYALVPAWIQDEGIAREMIAMSMLVTVLGGLAFQIPVGRPSDHFDRRVVLAILAHVAWLIRRLRRVLTLPALSHLVYEIGDNVGESRHLS
jgi:hypothetical protein